MVLHDQTGMRQFQDLVGDCNQFDMTFMGALFTWWNKRDEDPIGKKLDRALINAAWLRVYPQSFSQFEAGGISDHDRCVVQLSGSHNETRKPFHFFNYLREHEEFLLTVKRVWESTQVIYHSRSSLSKFHAKLKLLKYDMRLLKKTHYGDLHNRTKLAFEEMCRCQNQALQDLNPVTFVAAAEASER